MLELNVDLNERSYPIYIGENLLSDKGRLIEHVGQSRPVIISNETVAPLYLEVIESQLSDLSPLHFVIPDGEQYKSLDWFEKICAFLLENNCGRDTCLIALGGGVIGDLTGFVASAYQRGVPFIQIPTTLLSQVDSSVGGKTAVNHPLGKNMIGAFYQPKAVFIDTNSLNTLPAREFSAGMAEVIKYGLIYDADFLTKLESDATQLKSLNTESLNQIIYRCCEIKAEIVAKDEKEAGLRALLNLGHTFGHAIEAQMGYGNWLHGEAVAAGIALAMELGQQRGDINKAEVTRVRNLLAQYDLPTSPPTEMTSEQFIHHMRKDKKNKKGKIRFIVPTSLGVCELVDDVSDANVGHLIGQ
ncbi:MULTISPECIES: 3-dehydroquinate synthase [Pseudoalteromonas]|uniref:3-dehydroquinate synthase n=1 Tax=Pseudoalteromonas luteoviolacea (strain 2ta16) TaxID=1353533 RepID=V4HYG7_PSEL2|nr:MULTISPECIES: 3-dehydroquinate synthase [Pseudoalteromonas]ESP94823.1 3-dehydroquinate synthase [Pseudoalteromonas luteoviolacea 2ta16]KZN42777.1 3-dehydroquinate synthase [Pseudoalteromonas luteoviolacea NCIMB 1944]MCG7549705.1 3-dehydroquinate synthase [Pseudoalteromonas sp. Of7M-16]